MRDESTVELPIEEFSIGCVYGKQIHIQYNSQWAHSPGLTAVCKFKSRLPAQSAVGTHRKGPGRMGLPELTDQSDIQLKFEIKFSL